MKSTRIEQPLPDPPAPKPKNARDSTATDSPPGASIAERSVQRTLANRRSTYSDEVARLIRAAVNVMQRSDSSNPTVSVSQTVTEAGLSNQAFYRHFQSKDEFLLAILDDGLRQLLVYLEHEIAKATSPLEKIQRWVHGVLAQSMHHDAAEPTRAVLANSSHLLYSHPEEFRRCEEVIERPLRLALQEGEASGVLAPLDLDRDISAIYRLTMGSMEVSLARSQPPGTEDVEHLMRLIFRALGVGDAASVPGNSGAEAARFPPGRSTNEG
jgi:AcrR family transcriptional regulator